MKYYANFLTNNGSRFMTPVEFTNKKEAIKFIKDVVKSEYYAQAGGKCSYRVDDEHGNNVEYGSLSGFSTRFHIEKLIPY